MKFLAHYGERRKEYVKTVERDKKIQKAGWQLTKKKKSSKCLLMVVEQTSAAKTVARVEGCIFIQWPQCAGAEDYDLLAPQKS